MKIYKVHINDRNYGSWTYYNTTDFQQVELSIRPDEYKLLSNDVFSFDSETNLTPSTVVSGVPSLTGALGYGSLQITIHHSSIRTCTSIPGVIILKNNKTYGRAPNGKLLYKCIPDDKRLPAFLIPYEIKNIGFSKIYTNHYITFNYVHWDDKHPRGVLTQMIGCVDILDNFYEYQLYCKSLNASIQKFNKDTNTVIKIKPHNDFIDNISAKYPSIEDRSDQKMWKVFTIDPHKSVDFDDGFSIRTIDNGIQQLSIYISNVTVWMDVLNLWESFSRRISTIYLPDRKRPMLPTILSDCLCSLQSNHTRIAFVMDVFIEADTIRDIKYSNCKINVYKNYCYEEPDLLMNDNYKILLELTRKISVKYKYINSIRNSHDVVCYLMILMNYHSAKELLRHKNGIFRSTIIKKEFAVPEHIPEDVGKFIKIWNSSSGQYIDVSSVENDESISHDLLEMDAYIHITSPIRRLVDLLNIIKFQQNSGIIQLSENAANFYNNWLKEIDYINTTMRSIRKVQNDCSLLHYCATTPEVMEKEYSGYAFDKIVRNDGLFQYIVYLPELRLASRVTLRDDIENYSARNFKLYLFHDEDNYKKKIRLQLL